MHGTAARPIRSLLLACSASFALLAPFSGQARGADEGTAADGRGSRWVHRQDDVVQIIRVAEQPEALPYWYYRPDRYIGRHRRHGEDGGRPGLRYFRNFYPFDRSDYHRRAHPHTYRGQFGEEQDPDRLDLRFYSGPGYSPFSRQENDYGPPSCEPWCPQPMPTLPAMPDELGPAAPPPADSAPGIVMEPRAPAPQTPTRRPGGPRIFQENRGEVSPTAPHRQAELADYARAWSMLGRGQAESSQFAFSSLALMRPDRGLPKAGYALSMAMQGDFGQSVWAMRRAFSSDLNWQDLAPSQPLIEERLQALAERLADAGASGRLSRIDSSFMIAAIRFMLSDYEAAERALLDAIERGDRSVSTLMLRALIRRGSPPATGPAEPLPPERRGLRRGDLEA